MEKQNILVLQKNVVGIYKNFKGCLEILKLCFKVYEVIKHTIRQLFVTHHYSVKRTISIILKTNTPHFINTLRFENSTFRKKKSFY